MCDLVENYAKDYAKRHAKEYAKEAVEQAAKEAAKQTETDSALRLFQNGVDYKLVRASIISLSDEELEKIYQEAVNG